MAKNKSKKCGVCGVVCSDIVYARTWNKETYYYCHKCHHVDKQAKKCSAYEDRDRVKPKVKKKKELPYQTCEGCGGHKAKRPFKLCYNCYMRKKAGDKELDDALNTQLKLQEAPLASPESHEDPSPKNY